MSLTIFPDCTGRQHPNLSLPPSTCCAARSRRPAARWRAFQWRQRMNIRLPPKGGTWSCAGAICVAMCRFLTEDWRRWTKLHIQRPCVLVLHGAGKLTDAVGVAGLNQVWVFLVAWHSVTRGRNALPGWNPWMPPAFLDVGKVDWMRWNRRPKHRCVSILPNRSPDTF